ncbi:hypothetical protein C5C24_16245 [Rathayibacter sp. AY2B3]|nr:hypothetical protein C5C24_16245 [Rathayibacter sp. AY2B3]
MTVAYDSAERRLNTAETMRPQRMPEAQIMDRMIGDASFLAPAHDLVPVGTRLLLARDRVVGRGAPSSVLGRAGLAPVQDSTAKSMVPLSVL